SSSNLRRPVSVTSTYTRSLHDALPILRLSGMPEVKVSSITFMASTWTAAWLRVRLRWADLRRQAYRSGHLGPRQQGATRAYLCLSLGRGRERPEGCRHPWPSAVAQVARLPALPTAPCPGHAGRQSPACV